MTASQDLARAISTHAKRHARQQGLRSFYAKILKLDPLTAEVTSQRLILDDDDLILSQSLRRYDYDYGLEVGDTLLVTQMPNDDFLAHDVIAAYPTLEGAEDTDPDTSVRYASRNGPIIARIEVADQDGNRIGWHPVYQTLHDDYPI